MRRSVLAATLLLTACAGAVTGPDTDSPVTPRNGAPRHFFAASDHEHGKEPWITDGTAGGTSLLKDVAPGGDSSSPSQFTPVGSVVYFAVEQPRRQLWKSDGTAAGTVLVRDFGPMLEPGGPAGSGTLDRLTAVGQRLFFSAHDPVHGREPWTSDGTEAGTRLVADLHPGPTGSWIDTITDFRQEAFFNVYMGDASDFALYRSDGSAAGTREVFRFSDFLSPLSVGARLLVGTPHDVFASDGTQRGTVLLQPFNPGRTLQHRHMRVNGGHAFFALWDDLMLSIGAGSQLWKSDGTSRGTVRIKDLERELIWDATLTAVGPNVFFMTSPWPAGHPMSPKTLWKSDGTEAGTVPLGPIATGSSMSVEGTHDRLFIDLWHVEADGSSVGAQLWTSDGTVEGTRLLRRFFLIVDMETVGGAVYFLAKTDPQASFDLWKSDGTEEGTVLVRAFS
jgi:ELWxxDGT repeat protein